MYPQNNLMQQNQPYTSYMANSSAFKQEIARMEINVVRPGKSPLPITKVPRLEKDDILKVRLLDEQVNGLKPDQSNFDWTFLIAFINPGRNNDSEKTVSEEINFRKRGWYKEYSFNVPYDSQPIFFLYPKPQYRAKILSLIGKNQDEIRKIGEKTIEIADAYAKIGTFLNELQTLLNRNSYGMYGSYGNYGMYGNYGNYGMYGNYGNYGINGNTGRPFNQNLFMEQTIEQLAKGFNIQMPGCWGNNPGYNGYNNYGTYPNNNIYNGYNYGFSNDLVARVQCVARSVRIEDFDLSVSRLLQQGGILAVAQLSQKYPQIAFWINMAASALDLILQITRKTPLKVVPTIISTNENQIQATTSMYSSGGRIEPVKISLFAESQPSNNGFVTAYPLVVNKWQANSDPTIISLPIPSLTDSCLHAGQNFLRSTDLMNDWMSDNFTKDFKLVISSSNGFLKEFPLKKNIGLSGWELNLTKEDLNIFPKIQMSLEAVLVGTRGFNEIKSPRFFLPVSLGGNWEITPDSQRSFAVGGKRIITLKNSLGSCRCLQAVVYKPSFGGQFIFEANARENGLQYSYDNKEVSFEVDTANFQSGSGQLELRQSGAEPVNLNISLHPMPPNITDLKIAKGDNQAVVIGERLEQIHSIKINGKTALLKNVSGLKSTPVTNVGSNIMASGGMPGKMLLDERIFAFEDPNAIQDTNNISLEIELESGRTFQFPKIFSVSPTRPKLVANQAKEIEGIAISKSSEMNNNAAPSNQNKPLTANYKKVSQLALGNLPVFPISSSEISVNVQNALTDYDFKVENLQVETRIENSMVNPSDLPGIVFEVLDWKNLRISFQLNEQTQRLLGGRRLQFRLLDKERGNSDWYTFKQTFIRVPEITLVKCAPEMNGMCELKANGIDYIAQVSTDGGRSWFPEMTTGLQIQSSVDGQKAALIPHFSNKNLLQIRLRDFPNVNLAVSDYNFINLVKGTPGQRNQPNRLPDVQPAPNQIPNQMPGITQNTQNIGPASMQSIPIPTPLPNKSSKAKPNKKP